MKSYAKKREPIRAVQWTGEMTSEITELLGEHLLSIDGERLIFANAKGPGRFAEKGDWIGSAPGEDLFVIGDAQFRKIYEELDGSEIATAIGAWLFSHGIVVSGPRTITVNGEPCSFGSVYVDPSGFVIANGKKWSGRG